MTPINLRTEYQEQPPAIDTQTPRFTWNLPDGIHAAGFQVNVCRSLDGKPGAIVWDSGRLPSEQMRAVYAGPALESRWAYFWMVRVITEDDEPCDWSRPAPFRMGLLNASDWKAQWVGASQDTPSPLIRKSFFLDSIPEQSRVYVSGLGAFYLHINGRPVCDGVLDPAQTDYEKRVFYRCFDITGFLQEGENVCGVWLGKGWYDQDIVWGGISYGKPCFILQIEGKPNPEPDIILASGAGWEWHPSPITMNNIYGGETFDARLEVLEWAEPGDSSTGWLPASVVSGPEGRLQSQSIDPIRVTEELATVQVTTPEPGVHVFDLGQNFAGWPRLELKSPPVGSTVAIQTAEILDEKGYIQPGTTGVIHTKVIQTETYTTAGRTYEGYEPRFTYHGFRYAQVTGLPEPPSLENITGIVAHTDVKPAGSFHCSDDMLNRIHKASVWTLRSNLHGLPSDCPHREKCGWLGDAQVVCEMSIFNYDMLTFWEKYLDDIETSLTEDGLPTMVAPGKRKIGPASPDWGTALIQIPWYLHLYYGDDQAIQQHYPSMERWMRHLEKISEGFIVSEGLGDWCAPHKLEGHTPIPITSTAYFYLDAWIMSQAASLLGRDDESRRFAELARGIHREFINKFYDTSTESFGTQTANAFALYLDLIPAGRRQAVADSLARRIVEEFDGHHRTGITGSRHLYWALTEHGHADVAWRILHNEDYPSIGQLFKWGATTLWECWGEKWIDEQEGDRSRNHPMQAGFDAWFFSGVGGINPVLQAPGFRKVHLKPAFLPQLDQADVHFESVRGGITSSWHREGKEVLWDVVLPEGVTGIVPATIACKDNLTTQLDAGSLELSNHEGTPAMEPQEVCLGLVLPSGQHSLRLSP